MKRYANITFTPQLHVDKNEPDTWGKQNYQRLSWVEDVGCTVLNYLKCDEFLRAKQIIEILDKTGRRDLVPGNLKKATINGQLHYSKLGSAFSAKMNTALDGTDRLFLMQISMFRHEEVMPQHKFDTIYKAVWFHFFPDPDFFNYRTGMLFNS